MFEIPRGGYVLLTWRGAHSPHHVHVLRRGKLVLKWNVESRVPMWGRPSRRVLRLIRQLESEGRL